MFYRRLVHRILPVTFTLKCVFMIFGGNIRFSLAFMIAFANCYTWEYAGFLPKMKEEGI